MNTELQNLLSLISQGGEIKVSGEKLLVSPASLANRFADQIRRLKPELMLALGHCPKCGSELITETKSNHSFADTPAWQAARKHLCCPTPGHYDKWEKG